MLRKLAVPVALGCLLAFATGCEKKMQGTPQDLGAIEVRVPSGWTSETPSSSMRKAQYVLPKQGSDAEDASLVVYYFGPGQGGSVDANLDRWYGQFKEPDGSDPAKHARVDRKTVDGMAVTLADVSGTYAPSAMGPAMPAGKPEPGYRMLAAIVESPQGSYYFKLTGPENTVAHWKKGFDRFIDTIKKH